MPSRLGNLLGIKVANLERVIYFQDYIVVDPGDTPLEEYQLLTEDEYRQSRAKYGAEFDADMGAEAVRKMLRLDLQMLSRRAARGAALDALEAAPEGHHQAPAHGRDAARLGQQPRDWMVLDVIPVIPPDLRPLVLLDSGNFATSAT